VALTEDSSIVLFVIRTTGFILESGVLRTFRCWSLGLACIGNLRSDGRSGLYRLLLDRTKPLSIYITQTCPDLKARAFFVMDGGKYSGCFETEIGLPLSGGFFLASLMITSMSH
jgi:hypothetical protein